VLTCANLPSVHVPAYAEPCYIPTKHYAPNTEKRMVPDAATAASGGSLLFAQYRPFAILKPKNRKGGPIRAGSVRTACYTVTNRSKENGKKHEASRNGCVMPRPPPLRGAARHPRRYELMARTEESSCSESGVVSTVSEFMLDNPSNNHLFNSLPFRFYLADSHHSSCPSFCLCNTPPRRKTGAPSGQGARNSHLWVIQAI
jgi:hypothetical protein